MALTYYQTSTTSDLTGPNGTGGTTRNLVISTTAGGGATALSTGNMNSGINCNQNFFTVAAEPGTRGTSTGSFSVVVTISVQNANIGIQAYLARVNSSGVQQAEVQASQGSQTAGAASRTFTWSSPALGTWASGDRLRLRLLLTNTSGSMNQSASISVDTSSETVDTPFTPGITPKTASDDVVINMQDSISVDTGSTPISASDDVVVNIQDSMAVKIYPSRSFMRFKNVLGSTATPARLEAPSNQLYSYSGQTDMVAEFEFRSRTATPGVGINQTIVSKWRNSTGFREWIHPWQNGNSFRFQIAQADGTIRTFGVSAAGHVAETWTEYRLQLVQSTDTHTLFRNGSSIGTTQDTAWDGTYEDLPGAVDAAKVMIGARNENLTTTFGNDPLHGDIARVTVYTNTARTTKLFEIDFRNPKNCSNPGTWTQWVDSNGNTWTMEGTAGTEWEYFEAGGSNDNLAVIITDTISVAQYDAKSASDDVIVVVDDQITIEKQFDLSDSVAVIVDDQVAIEKQFDLSDTVAVVLADSISVDTGSTPVNISDSAAVVIGDQISIDKQFELSDSVVVVITDSINVDKQFELSDSIAVVVGDAIELEKQFDLTDSVVVAISDSIVVSDNDKNVSDSLVIALDDQMSIDKQLELSDSVVVNLVDSISVNTGDSTPISAADTVAARLTERMIVHGTPFPVFESVTSPLTAVTGGGGTSIDVVNATDADAGDLLIAAISWRGIGTITATDGEWTELHDFPDTIGPQLAVYVRPASASEPATYNFTFSGSASRVMGGITRITNHDGIEAWAENSGNSTTPTAPSVVSQGADRLLLVIYARSHTNLLTAPSGKAVRWDENTLGTDAGAVGQLGFTEVVGSGATGTRVAALDTTAREWRAVSLLIAPASPIVNMSDNVTVNLDDQISVNTDPFNVSDSIAVNIQDSISVSTDQKSASDNVTINMVDAVSSIRKLGDWSEPASAYTFADVEINDSLVIAVDDQIVADGSMFEKELSDGITLYLNDNISIDIDHALVENLPVNLVDTISVYKEQSVSASDNVTIAIDDQMELEKHFSVSDTLAVVVSDDIQVNDNVTPISASDSVVVAIGDQISIDRQVDLADSVVVNVVDSISVDKDLNIADSVTVAMVDSISIDKDLSLTDSVVVAINDQIGVAELHEKSASDSIVIAVADSISVENVINELDTTVEIDITVESLPEQSVTINDLDEQSVVINNVQEQNVTVATVNEVTVAIAVNDQDITVQSVPEISVTVQSLPETSVTIADPPEVDVTT